MYEMINEELGIKACHIADFTTEIVENILGQWREGIKIRELTLFYDRETGDIVLNKDNELYEYYLDLTEKYLSASKEVRDEIREICPIKNVGKTMDVLEDCVKRRVVDREIYRAIKGCIMNERSLGVLNCIFKRYSSNVAELVAFQYGVMEGKRMERAKHKPL